MSDEKLSVQDGMQIMALLQDYMDAYTLTCIEHPTDATKFKKEKIIKEVTTLITKYGDMIFPNLSFSEYFKQSFIGSYPPEESQEIIGDMAKNHVRFIQEEVPKRLQERMEIVKKSDSIVNQANNILKGAFEKNGNNIEGTGKDTDSKGDTERGTDESI
jgi:hypothetical protein